MGTRKFLSLILSAVLAGSAFGASITAKWTGTVSDDWDAAGNWDLGRVPNLTIGTNKGDYVWVNYRANRPEGAAIYSGDHAAYAVYVMREGVDDNTKTAILNLNGGSLSICNSSNGGEFKLGAASTQSYFAAHPLQPGAVVNMYDGFTVNQNGTGGTTIGDYYNGVLNLYGGTYNQNGGAFRISNYSYNGGSGYGSGTLNLFGGVVNINVWDTGLLQAALKPFTPKSKINVGDGMMTLVGNNASILQGYADAGQIEALSGKTLVIEYNPNVGIHGTTYLYAIPEPATVGLLSLAGFFILRKKKL